MVNICLCIRWLHYVSPTENVYYIELPTRIVYYIPIDQNQEKKKEPPALL